MAIKNKALGKALVVFAIVFSFSIGLAFQNKAVSQTNLKCGPQSISVSRTISLKNTKAGNYGGKYPKLKLLPFEVVLTFDDGPNPKTTNEILTALENECVKATFFMLGDKIEESPTIARNVITKGHSIGLHSYSHLSMQSLEGADQIRDFQKTEKIAEMILGQKPKFYRFPFLQDTQILTDYLNQNGVNVLSVDAIGYDWLETADIQSVHKAIFSQLEMNNNSGIILLHDNRELAAIALPSLLKALKRKGYKIVVIEN